MTTSKDAPTQQHLDVGHIQDARGITDVGIGQEQTTPRNTAESKDTDNSANTAESKDNSANTAESKDNSANTAESKDNRVQLRLKSKRGADYFLDFYLQTTTPMHGEDDDETEEEEGEEDVDARLWKQLTADNTAASRQALKYSSRGAAAAGVLSLGPLGAAAAIVGGNVPRLPTTACSAAVVGETHALPKGSWLDYSRQNLKCLPLVELEDVKLPESVLRLDLNNNQISKSLRLDRSEIECPTPIEEVSTKQIKISLAYLPRFTNLRFLDLSENQLTSLDGLESLYHLTDLNLTGNRIQTITGGIDDSVKLEVILLANNAIRDVQQIGYLRRFSRLRCLTLEGNPFCVDDTAGQKHENCLGAGEVSSLSGASGCEWCGRETKSVCESFKRSVATAVVGRVDMFVDWTLVKQTDLDAARQIHKSFAEKFDEMDCERDAGERLRQQTAQISERRENAFLKEAFEVFEELYVTNKSSPLTLLTSLDSSFERLWASCKETCVELLDTLETWLVPLGEARRLQLDTFKEAVRELERESDLKVKEVLMRLVMRKSNNSLVCSSSSSCCLWPSEVCSDSLESRTGGEDGQRNATAEVEDVQNGAHRQAQRLTRAFELRASEGLQESSIRIAEFFSQLEQFETEISKYALEYLRHDRDSLRSCLTARTLSVQRHGDAAQGVIGNWLRDFMRAETRRQDDRHSRRVTNSDEVLEQLNHHRKTGSCTRHTNDLVV